MSYISTLKTIEDMLAQVRYPSPIEASLHVLPYDGPVFTSLDLSRENSENKGQSLLEYREKQVEVLTVSLEALLGVKTATDAEHAQRPFPQVQKEWIHLYLYSNWLPLLSRMNEIDSKSILRSSPW